MLSEDISAIADSLDRIARACAYSNRPGLTIDMDARISRLRHCADRAVTLEAHAAAIATIPHEGKVS